MSTRKQARARRAEVTRVLGEMQEIRARLMKAYACFDTSNDPGLTEASIFEINALRAHYDHALRSVKLKMSLQ